MSTDRPTPRPRPRPAPDAGTADPADLPAAWPVAESARAASGPSDPDALPDDLPLSQVLRMSAGPTEQLGTRIAKPIRKLLRETSAASGVKERALLEYAIVRAFGTEEGRRQWRER